MRIIITLISFVFILINYTSWSQDLNYIKNLGQWNEAIHYKLSLNSGALFITSGGMAFNWYDASQIPQHGISDDNEENKIPFYAYKVNLLNSNNSTQFEEEEPLPYYHNYILGKDSTKWKGHVPLFKNITQKSVYPLIDIKYYQNELNFKYDFIIAPGGNPHNIILDIAGAQPSLNQQGALLIPVGFNTIIENKPIAYQIVNQDTQFVKVNFLIKGNAVSFELPDGFNSAIPLIIDPELIFSTYSGSTASTYGFSATYDSAGNFYSGGFCFNVGWPVTSGAYDMDYNSGIDIVINKYNPTGTNLLYATYLGGTLQEHPNSLIVNHNNDLVIAGSTMSPDFPMKYNSYKVYSSGNYDVVVAIISKDGNELIGATYFGGSNVDGYNISSLSSNYGDENRCEVQLDEWNNIYVSTSTSSHGLPTTASAVQHTLKGLQNGLILKFNSDCSALNYCSYLGGSDRDAAFSFVIKDHNELIITGATTSNDFPVTSGSLQTIKPATISAFISILHLDDGLKYSSFLGSDRYSHGYKVQYDGGKRIYLLGQVKGDYPISPGVFAKSNGDIFIDVLDTMLQSRLLTTRLGNTQSAYVKFVPSAFMLDKCGNVYLSGYYANSYNECTADAFSTEGASHLWMGVLSPNFASLKFGSFFGVSGFHLDGGSSRFDPNGIIYQSICVCTSGLPTTPNAYKTGPSVSGCDIGSFKIQLGIKYLRASFTLYDDIVQPICNSEYVRFNNTSIYANGYLWDFGDGNTSDEFEPEHKYEEPGTYTIKLLAFNDTMCNPLDSMELEIEVIGVEKPIINISDTFYCNGQPSIEVFYEIENWNENMLVFWSQSEKVVYSDHNSSVLNLGDNVNWTITVRNYLDSTCYSEASKTITITPRIMLHDVHIVNEPSICLNDTLFLKADYFEDYKYNWQSSAAQFSDKDSHETYAKVFKEGLIYLIVEDELGCTKFEKVNLVAKNCCALLIPNAFSPNNDGKNDYFELKFIENQQIINYFIFDRFGKKVFEGNKITDKWDGYFNSRKADIGVYYYYVHYLCGDGNEYVEKGDITLLK